MQFTVLTLFAAASLVVATPVPELNAYPVAVTNVGVANPGLQVRAKSKAHAPAPVRVGSNDSFQTNSCNAAERQCCQNIHQTSDNTIQTLLGLLSIAIPVDGLVGTQCSPITGVLSGTSACNSQPVCCSGNHYGGLISLGCSPISGLSSLGS